MLTYKGKYFSICIQFICKKIRMVSYIAYVLMSLYNLGGKLMIKKVKRVFGICLVLVVGSSFRNTVFASCQIQEDSSSSVIFCTGPCSKEISSDNSPALPQSARYEDAMIHSKAASIRVDIQTPLEVSWRNTHSSYYYDANNVVETIDDMLYDKFGIDFYTVSQPSWNVGSVAVPSVAMNLLKSNIGKGNADIMLAFAGPIFDTATSAGYGMTSALGEPYCIVFDHGAAQNNKSAQHEIGHAYGLSHCSSSCVMKQGSNTNLLGKLCSKHNSEWSKAKNKY